MTGALISTYGGHWVGGTATDAGGLPIVGWVRDGGDLRVAHFFALHAIQLIPLFGAGLAATGLRNAVTKPALALGILVYIILVCWTAVEAFAARAFLAGLLW